MLVLFTAHVVIGKYNCYHLIGCAPLQVDYVRGELDDKDRMGVIVFDNKYGNFVHTCSLANQFPDCVYPELLSLITSCACQLLTKA
jgi:hypothetical protein